LISEISQLKIVKLNFILPDLVLIKSTYRIVKTID